MMVRGIIYTYRRKGPPVSASVTLPLTLICLAITPAAVNSIRLETVIIRKDLAIFDIIYLNMYENDTPRRIGTIVHLL